MPLAFTLTKDNRGTSNHWSDTKRLHVVGTVVATGNYVNGTGDALNFLTEPLIKSNTNPLYVHMTGRINAYKATYNQATGLVKFYLAGTELASGAYPAAITGDVFNVYAIFPKFL